MKTNSPTGIEFTPECLPGVVKMMLVDVYMWQVDFAPQGYAGLDGDFVKGNMQA